MTRQRDVVHRVVVPLAEVQDKIPRNESGDPQFTNLCEEEYKVFHNLPVGDNSVLAVFTPTQVVAIVNRWLYQAEYQQVVHRKRAEEQRALQKPVKEAFKRLFPQTSFINATEEQITAAVRAAAEREVER